MIQMKLVIRNSFSLTTTFYEDGVAEYANEN